MALVEAKGLTHFSLPANDVEESNVVPMGENGWLVQAKLPIGDFNELVKADLAEDEEWKTIGGLVASVMGNIPEPGDEVKYHGFSFRVERMQRRRIDTVLVRRLELPSPSEAAR